MESEYLEDRKYIHEKLEHTTRHLERIDDKFEDFKTTVTTSIAVIQTKLAMYVAIGSLLVGVVVNVAMSFIGSK